MDTSDLTGRTVVVTGAGSGIGRETALAFARRGADLVVCDVNEAASARTADDIRALGRKAAGHAVDVADAARMRAFADVVHAEVDAIDVLVNNAGVGLGATFLDTTLEDWGWIIGINLLGVVHGCHFFVPKMAARGRGGHVVNVASAAGYVASAGLSAYSTTKFAVVGLSEALREELAPSGIGVTAVCPGIINTPITEAARLRGKAALPGAREQMVEFYRRRDYGPELVAEKILKAVARNAALAPVTPEAWAMYFLKRLSPRLMVWLNRRIAERFERRLQARRVP
ncbi:MAG TPA: SDR family NAD(P)-dependent oxidoreductase [Candidatus Binatia bacterium]|nr:SDR family NAD(P)-dependent oxidoreductase [Candidatus Binatia bacterium]